MSIGQDALEAGYRLWSMAQKDTHQGRHVAHFLLGLYNGQLFPFDLTRLRGLDRQPLDDCMAVLCHCSTYSRLIQKFLDVPNAEFDALAIELGLWRKPSLR